MGVPFAADRFYGTSLPVKLPYPDDFPAFAVAASTQPDMAASPEARSRITRTSLCLAGGDPAVQ
jgi:hypothetical protein